MRVVLVSTHTDQTTGYSKVAHNLVRQLSTLSPRVKLFHFGFQRHPNRPSIRKIPDGVVQYDAAANEDPKEDGFGFNKIHEYLEMVQPDLVLIYNDPLIIYRMIEAMKHERGKSAYKLWIYLDQVYEGIAAPLIENIHKHADRVYCFTETWKQKFLEYGHFPDVQVLEHAVDPGMFSHVNVEARRTLRGNMNLPQDAIVLLNANRNSQRKRLDLTIAGFVNLLQERPKEPYYLAIATNMNPQSGAYYDLQRIFMSELKFRGLDFQEFGMRLILVDTSPPNVVNDESMNSLYNVADIGINTSDGEGYGLCQLEHLYTGSPQIVCDIGSYRSFLNEDVAAFVPPGDRVYFPGNMPLGFYAYSFCARDVADAMKKIIDNLPEYKKNVKNYTFKTWANVCDSWLEDVLALKA
jgi:D-inositol-3-phosphate glycosyltransferase